MLRYQIEVIIISIILLISNGAEASRVPEFSERWETEKYAPLQTLDPAVLSILQNRHFLFIPGIMNEFIFGFAQYYSANLNSVQQDIGANFSVYWPASKYSILDNSEKIYQQIVLTYRNFKKPIIVIGHSKGAAEILYAILHHPDLILTKMVDRVILIQAAIGGSPLETYCGQNWLYPMRHGLRWYFYQGIKSLNPYQAFVNFEVSYRHFEHYLDNLWSDFGEEIVDRKRDEISKRIFYLRSYAKKEKLSLGLKIILQACGHDLEREGPNDGIILTEDQKSDVIGTDLGAIEADHMETVVSGYFSGKNDLDREAFTRALLQTVYDVE